jgi:hypothetical protein
LSPELAELAEESLSQGNLSVLPSVLIHQIEEFPKIYGRPYSHYQLGDDDKVSAITFPAGDSRCSYDGDDGE